MNKGKAEPGKEATLDQAQTVELDIFVGTSIFNR